MWILQQSSLSKGDYTFSGRCIPSPQANLLLSEQEIKEIHLQLRQAATAQEGTGLDCYQVFYEEGNRSGIRLIAMDNLSVTEIEALQAEDDSDAIHALNYWSLFVEGQRN